MFQVLSRYWILLCRCWVFESHQTSDNRFLALQTGNLDTAFKTSFNKEGGDYGSYYFFMFFTAVQRYMENHRLSRQVNVCCLSPLSSVVSLF